MRGRCTGLSQVTNSQCLVDAQPLDSTEQASASAGQTQRTPSQPQDGDLLQEHHDLYDAQCTPSQPREGTSRSSAHTFPTAGREAGQTQCTPSQHREGDLLGPNAHLPNRWMGSSKVHTFSVSGFISIFLDIKPWF